MWHGICLSFGKHSEIPRKKEMKIIPKKRQKSENKAKVLDRIVDNISIGNEQKELRNEF
tara:strand:+ start:488 stop:664 length:177 start_codon:yes stop_codon:yes gene_type:complete